MFTAENTHLLHKGKYGCRIRLRFSTGFEPRNSGIGSDCSNNRATTTALKLGCLLRKKIYFLKQFNLQLSASKIIS